MKTIKARLVRENRYDGKSKIKVEGHVNAVILQSKGFKNDEGGMISIFEGTVI